MTAARAWSNTDYYGASRADASAPASARPVPAAASVSTPALGPRRRRPRWLCQPELEDGCCFTGDALPRLVARRTLRAHLSVDPRHRQPQTQGICRLATQGHPTSMAARLAVSGAGQRYAHGKLRHTSVGRRASHHHPMLPREEICKENGRAYG